MNETTTEQEPVAWIERDIQSDDFDPDSVTFEKPRIAASSGWEWVPLCAGPPQRTWVGLMRGVRVDGDTVVITVKGGNDAARELCGELLKVAEHMTQEALAQANQPSCDLAPDGVCETLGCPNHSAQPEQEPKHYSHTWGKDGERCVVCGDKDWMGTSCKKISAPQPEQEPVACEHKRTSIWTEDQTGHCNDCGASGRMRFIADTTPPQRKPLLASEIVTMYAECPTSDSDMIEFARAIEAAHGIKE